MSLRLIDTTQLQDQDMVVADHVQDEADQFWLLSRESAVSLGIFLLAAIFCQRFFAGYISLFVNITFIFYLVFTINRMSNGFLLHLKNRSSTRR